MILYGRTLCLKCQMIRKTMASKKGLQLFSSSLVWVVFDCIFFYILCMIPKIFSSWDVVVH